MKGIVIKSTGLWYEVKAGQENYRARLRGKIRLDDKKLTNPVAVGDVVELEANEQIKGEWVIRSINPRTNYLTRKSPRKKGHDHLIAANIDQGLLIVTLKMPRTSTGFIDRFLISLETFRIPGIIAFNKKDLYDAQDLQRFELLREVYSSAGYDVSLHSFKDTSDQLTELLKGKTTLLSGHSGAGKSTFVNNIVPHAAQEVKEVSSFANKGVHTTTFAEMFFPDNETAVIDTPGIKELGLSEVEGEELSHFFPEMRQYLGTCKFHNCLHLDEPGCQVKSAVGKTVSALRYESYKAILSETDNRK